MCVARKRSENNVLGTVRIEEYYVELRDGNLRRNNIFDGDLQKGVMVFGTEQNSTEYVSSVSGLHIWI